MNVERWAWCSLGLNVLLAVLHALIAAASGSLALAAEVVHNVTDFVAATVVLAGIRLATRKSKEFPYGLYKLENLASLVLSGLIFLSAYEIGRDALLAPAEPVRAEGWMLMVLLATGALPLLFGHYEMRAGRKANSPALMADAKEYRVHAFTTGIAFAAIASPWVGFALDRIAALLIVVAVVAMGWGLLRDSMRVLLDASLDADSLNRIRAVIDADPSVTGIKWVTGRNAGRFRFVEAGVVLRIAGLAAAETAMRRIEAAVRAAVPNVERVLLQIERPDSGRVRCAVPLSDAAGNLSPHFGEAPCFALLTLRRADGGIEEQRVVTNPFQSLPRAKGIHVAEWLVAQKVDVILLQEDLGGKGPDHVLREAGVTLGRAHGTVLDEVLSSAAAAGLFGSGAFTSRRMTT